LGVNDSGQITGYGLMAGQYHAYLLTPDSTITPPPPDHAPVPETATMLLMGTGLAGLARFRLRRKKN
jgi:hypothetical protein